MVLIHRVSAVPNLASPLSSVQEPRSLMWALHLSLENPANHGTSPLWPGTTEASFHTMRL